MTTSETGSNGNGRNGSTLRRVHRWLGILLVFFILLLSISGIALNHSSGWRLDSSFVSADWLLDAYGIRSPADVTSFADHDHRATLLGDRLYLDDREIAEDIESLTGIVSLDSLILVTTSDNALVLTTGGELIEQIDLASLLPAPIERSGRSGQVAVISSGESLFVADADISGFERSADIEGIDWSKSSAVPPSLQDSLESLYRGRGLTIERVIADIHSGRIIGITGPYLMDAVAILLIVLGISGLLMWLRPRKKKQ